MRFKYILVLLITFFGFQDTFSQGKSIDSLMNLSYDDLDKIYYETESITDKENIIIIIIIIMPYCMMRKPISNMRIQLFNLQKIKSICIIKLLLSIIL